MCNLPFAQQPPDARRRTTARGRTIEAATAQQKRSSMLLRLLLALLLCCASAPHEAPRTVENTLEAAFRAFAQCASASERDRLEKRLAFFSSAGLRSEAEVKKLPKHTVKNEQEQLLAVQAKLLPLGVRVRLNGIARPAEELNGCSGTLIGCLRDGSFLCAVEIDECESANADELPVSVRVRVEKLRPAADCGIVTRTAASECAALTLELEEEAPLPLTTDAIGRLLVHAVHAYDEAVAQGRAHAELVSLGQTAYEDLSFGALLNVLVYLREAGCIALRGGDVRGATLAIDRALELEQHARPSSTETLELPLPVRSGFAALLALSSVLKAAKGDAAGARDDTYSAQRVNVSMSVSPRKLTTAVHPARIDGYRGTTDAETELVRLQRWWYDELLPLDDGAEERRVQSARAALKSEL
jgi:hypothetical protein